MNSEHIDKAIAENGREAEEALRLSEERLSRAQQIAHIGDWEWEIATGKVHWSDELYRIYGYEPREVAPDYGLVVEAMHPKSKDEFLGAIDAVLKGERPFEMDYTFFRRDGSEAVLHTIGKVIHDSNGTPERMVGTVQDITRQKRAEEALRQSEERFRTIFDSANDGIMIADISTKKFVEANKTICAMLGYTREEIAGLGIKDIHPGKDLPHVVEEFEKQMKGEKTIAGDLPVMRKDGSVFFADICAASITLGEDHYAVGIFRDITERKKTEEALRESEEALRQANLQTRTLLDAIPDIVFFKNSEGRHLVANKAYEILLGRRQDEIVGKTNEELLPPDLAERCSRSDAEVKRFGEAIRLEEVSGSGSEKRVFDTIKVPICDKSGKYAGLVGVIRDVTEQKKAEEELRNSREFVANILNTVDEGFIVIDRDYRIISANNAYCRQVGMPMTEIVGRHCYEVSHQRTKPCYESGEECAVHDTFRKGKLSVSVHQHNDRNGNVIFVETKSYPLKDASGNVTSAIEIVNNITDRHLLEEQLFRAQKLESVGLLAGGIAHDFNNLLQGVFGNVSLAKLFTDKDGKAYRALEEAEKAFDLSRNLTKQLLTFSKGGEPVKKVLSLSSIVQDSVKFALSGSRVDYRISIDDNLWPVEADEGQISQVMQNIVLNASDAMPEGGTVKIDVNNLLIDKEGTLPLKTGRYVLVSIEDTGSGIPEHHIRKIFDPYFTTKQKGSGLGLATSYSIIKKHNGTLDVKSRLGAGSTFFIYLPASDGKASFERARGSSPLTGKGKILVMDDEKIIITVVSIMLETLGYDVDSAGDGKEAVEKFSNALKAGRPFDAVILDLTVRGGMGGKETIMKLIEIDPSARAIVSSGYSDDPILANYSDYGFKATLSKPYELHELSDKLHSLIYTNGG